ncbi:hypothetical protein SEA_STEPHIG9_89 [Mycobacterium phage Stephig9]|uniref:Uncharacterized protein n=1 Tax=Mycobacterium phage Stephig9 TaxID=2591224 RepID=A0A514DHG3_9CAUD|nr:hypothetical protein SEA_STEPHIG9_89 [Mycobacterium phage Stephig9]
MTTLIEPIIIREGSSLRTQSELDLLFVQDVYDLAQLVPNYIIREQAEGLLNEASAAFHCQDVWTVDDLEEIACAAEGLLSDIGYTVEWTDGYIIREV